MSKTDSKSTELATIEPSKGIKARALELMRENQNPDAEFNTELELPFLRDLPFLKSELHNYMRLLVTRSRVHRVMNEENSDESDVFTPEKSMAQVTLKMSQEKPFEMHPSGNDKNRSYKRLNNSHEYYSSTAIGRAILRIAVKLGMKPETGATKVKAEITGVYEAIQFCLGIYNSGLVYYEQALTERQKKQGELLIRMAQEYSTELSETMVDIEASHVGKQYMPDIESTKIAEQLVNLRVGSSRQALKMALEAVEELDLHAEALTEMRDEELL